MSQQSKHYAGKAVDINMTTVDPGYLRKLAKALRLMRRKQIARDIRRLVKMYFKTFKRSKVERG